jgi:branched-chain amino acid transport system ATP-binding protein
LSDRKKQIASTLSGGEQQMLAIGRALMSRPQLLLLDEPSMGLAPNMVKKIFEIIQKIHARGISILLVEQNAYMALSIAEKAYVLEGGHISMEDSGKNLLNNPEVMKSYLGEVTNVSRRNNRNLYS